MLDRPTRNRPTLIKTRVTQENAPVINEPAPEIAVGQTKLSFQRFRLKVDGQIKDSFTTLDAAENRGLTIKQAYPIVNVSIYDSVEGGQKIIGLEKA